MIKMKINAEDIKRAACDQIATSVLHDIHAESVISKIKKGFRDITDQYLDSAQQIMLDMGNTLDSINTEIDVDIMDVVRQTCAVYRQKYIELAATTLISISSQMEEVKAIFSLAIEHPDRYSELIMSFKHSMDTFVESRDMIKHTFSMITMAEDTKFNNEIAEYISRIEESSKTEES